MLVIVGIIIVLGSVLTGFSMAGGHIHSLIHPSELVTIGGAALGAMVCSSPPKVLKDLMHGLIALLKGGNVGKVTYNQAFQLLYELFRIARRDGMLAWESILAEGHDNATFKKYPKIANDHHLLEFVTGALQGAMEGNDGPALQALLDTEIHVFEEEHHAAVTALTRTADGLPGFGIVAAVLGIVVTMGAIGGPVEEIGHKVGAALVGTFLGILMSYGMIGPVAGALDALGHAEVALRKTIVAAIVGFAGGGSPKAVMDNVRRGCGTAVRPSAKEMEELLKEVDAAK
ncbi:MAG: motility-associated protein [Planctomycetaceae bacterium]